VGEETQRKVSKERAQHATTCRFSKLLEMEDLHDIEIFMFELSSACKAAKAQDSA